MRLLLSQNCPQYCYKEKEEFNWWRTRWLRICDHTLTETETPPLDTSGVALPTLRFQHLFDSDSGVTYHAMRHAHQTPSSTR